MSSARPVALLVRRHVFLAVLAALLAGAAASFAAEARRFTSAWRDRDIHVDGVDEEWRDLTQPVKDEHFAVGFLNDGNDLYFCLVAKDETSIRRISRLGLVLWLDHAGGKQRSFGIRFPAGPAPGSTARRAPSEPERGRDEAEAGVGVGQQDIDILGPGKKDLRQVENGKSGIEARMRVKPGLLVYEMKVPLRKSEAAAFAPDVDPGAALRVQLQTPEWRGPVPLRRGWPAVGVGMGPGGRGVFYPGADTVLLKPMDIKGDLRLAGSPSR